MTVLAWAKERAPRSPSLREAYGLALYEAGRYSDAHAELLAYRRLSERQDQNHVLADCARALGRHEKVAEYVAALAASSPHPERWSEGAIVLSGSHADRGDLGGALRVLEHAGADAGDVTPWHPRLWYAAGDVCARMGKVERARDYFEAILSIQGPDESWDVAERLAALGAEPSQGDG